MNEITRIHLASLPYNAEVAAKKQLETYLAAVKRSLGADDDAMREIEARITELMSERGIKGEKVITKTDVDAVTKQLGDPKDFVDETEAEEMLEKKAPRRLYRDPQNTMLAGVCSGMAAYFKMDVVLMRLIWVVLTFVTSGLTIPVYIVMAFIMPPARTAAERLQMAGEPVTLASIKEESATLEDKPSGESGWVTALRWFVGLSFVGAAVITLMTLSFLTLQSASLVFSTNSWPIIASAFAIGTAGILFITACLVIGYALIANHFTKRIGYSLVILTILGLVLGSVAGGGLFMERDRIRDTYKSFHSEVTLNADVVTGATSLRVDAAKPLTIEYRESTAAPTMTLSYSKQSVKQLPKVDLTKNGDELVLTAAYEEKDCDTLMMGWCGEPVRVVITGPALTSINAKQSSVLYETRSQNELSVTAEKNGHVDISSEGIIETLTATLQGDANLDATDANVRNAKVSVTGRGSDVSFAQLATFDVTVPDSCATDYGYGVIHATGAGAMTVNGASYSADKDYPCARIRIEQD